MAGSLPRFAADPVELALRQLQLDKLATARLPVLRERKRLRQLISPHALFRGSAPLFYELLEGHRALAAGPEGEGFIVGDMHLENAGAYRAEHDEVVFDLNDFDDATRGPWRFDALRLATSVILAGRSFEASAPQALALAGELLESHARAACSRKPVKPPPQPEPIRKLIARARDRSNEALIAGRTEQVGKHRRFQYGLRYLPLAPALRAKVSQLMKQFVDVLGDRAPSHAFEWVIDDAAQRVAGTGSLGRVRIAVLLHDAAGQHRLFEFKQELPSAVERLGPRAGGLPGARIVTAARALVQHPPRLLAHVELRAPALSFIARRLCPEEDKLDLGKLRPGPELEAVVRTIGHVLGTAHSRAATTRPRRAWNDRDLQALLDRAVLLAGAFEALHLAYARLA